MKKWRNNVSKSKKPKTSNFWQAAHSGYAPHTISLRILISPHVSCMCMWNLKQFHTSFNEKIMCENHKNPKNLEFLTESARFLTNFNCTYVTWSIKTRHMSQKLYFYDLKQTEADLVYENPAYVAKAVILRYEADGSGYNCMGALTRKWQCEMREKLKNLEFLTKRRQIFDKFRLYIGLHYFTIVHSLLVVYKNPAELCRKS